MQNKIQDAFSEIKASPELKENCRQYLKSQREARQLPRTRFAPALAVCAVLLLLAAGVWRFLQLPVSYVSIDVNPSVELALNRLDRVVSARAYNDDGEAILKELSLEGKLYTEAIDLLLSSETMDLYLTDSSALTFTVAAQTQEKETVLRSGIEGCSGYRENDGQSYCADISSLEEAHGYGLSFGKYAAFLTLSQYDSSVTPEDCCHMTMAQLRERIRAHQCGSGGEETSCEPASGESACEPYDGESACEPGSGESCSSSVSCEAGSHSSSGSGSGQQHGHSYGKNHKE